MTTQEVANRLVELIRAGEYDKAHEELYHEDIVSIENPVNPNETMQYMESKGIEAKLKKSQEWKESVEEMHGGETSDPLVSDNAFSVVMSMDVTMKGAGRMQMSEVAVYSVREGKIVREEFIF